eukprot:155373-Pleurochrysis_carterae.AAC.1
MKAGGGKGSRSFAKNAPEFRWRAHFRARKCTHSPLYTDKAKTLKELRILRTEHELRQRGARGEIEISVQITSSGQAAISNVAENATIGSQDGQ